MSKEDFGNLEEMSPGLEQGPDETEELPKGKGRVDAFRDNPEKPEEEAMGILERKLAGLREELAGIGDNPTRQAELVREIEDIEKRLAAVRVERERPKF